MGWRAWKDHNVRWKLWLLVDFSRHLERKIVKCCKGWWRCNKSHFAWGAYLLLYTSVELLCSDVRVSNRVVYTPRSVMYCSFPSFANVSQPPDRNRSFIYSISIGLDHDQNASTSHAAGFLSSFITSLSQIFRGRPGSVLRIEGLL